MIHWVFLRSSSGFERATTTGKNTYEITTRSARDNNAEARQASNAFLDYESFVVDSNRTSDKITHDHLLSDDININDKTRDQLNSRVISETEHELSKIIAPENMTRKLPSGEGILPITITNQTGYAVRIKVSLSASPVSFIEGSSRTVIIERSSKTVNFKIKARTSGSFPIKITLSSPTRNAVLAQSIVSVGAFGATSVGLILSGISLLVLAIWWVRHGWRRRSKPSLT